MYKIKSKNKGNKGRSAEESRGMGKEIAEKAPRG